MFRVSKEIWDKAWRTCDHCDRIVKKHDDINHYGNEHNILFSICAKCDEDRDVEFEKELK